MLSGYSRVGKEPDKYAKEIPLKLWAEAMNYSVYVLDRAMSKSETLTPYQRYFGKSAEISNLRVFYRLQKSSLGVIKINQ